MKKTFLFLAAALLSIGAVSCSKKAASSEEDSITDSVAIQDTLSDQGLDPEMSLHPDGYEEAMIDKFNWEMLTTLYNGIVLTLDNPDYIDMSEKEIKDFVNTHFSSAAKKQVKQMSNYDDDMDFSGLRTGVQDGDGESKIIEIEPIGNNWYRVTFLDLGHKGTKEFLIENEVITKIK